MRRLASCEGTVIVDGNTEGDHNGVRVVYATRKGRDAADDRIRELLDDQPPTFVVTSDRELATSTQDKGVGVIGAGAFLGRLEDAGC